MLGPTHSFYWLITAWVARVALLTLISTFLIWLGIRFLDALTPQIHEREEIGKSAVSTGLFIGGFLIFLGLVIHGALTSNLAVGQTFLGSIVSLRRLSLIAASFFASVLLAVGLFNLFDRLTPKIDFRSIQDNPEATGVYVFGYMVFFGLIVHSALAMSI